MTKSNPQQSMSMILVVVASGSSGPWIPGVRTLLGGGARGVAARVKGGYYGGGEVAARVWGERRRWRRERGGWRRRGKGERGRREQSLFYYLIRLITSLLYL